jgi:anti-sigma regulatory factor (Ser/Thr protein kinase)
VNSDQPANRPAERDAGALLRASPLAPRQARATVRRALTAWGLESIAADAELLASELVANAAEHADGAPIGLTIREHAGTDGHHGIVCQITDTGPGLPKPRQAQPDSERGRGLRIVAALATVSPPTPTARRPGSPSPPRQN